MQKLSTANYKNVKLGFAYKANGLDYKDGEFDRFFVESSSDGVNWTTLMEVNGQSAGLLESSWRSVVVLLPTSAQTLFRFRAHFSDYGDRVWIDDLAVKGDPTEISEVRCRDKSDNDYDGLVDSKDSDCAPFYKTMFVNKLGEGTVTSNPAGISCGVACVGKFLNNALVTLTQTATRGNKFIGWIGDCIGNGVCAVTMDADKYVTAEFATAAPFTLTTANNEAGQGKIVSTPAGINCGTDCSETVYEGEQFSLTATPALGFDFLNWSGDCTGTNATCVLPDIQSDKSVVAQYVAKTPGICADSVVDWNEQCDDGNVTNSDGCSSTCTIEPGFTCSGSPSQCFFIELECTGYICILPNF